MLLVDENRHRLRNSGGTLRHHFEVLVARDGIEALDVLESGSRVDAILCELTMSIMPGRALYDRVVARFPEVAKRIVFVSRDPVGASRPRDTGLPFVVTAPAVESDLLHVVRLALGGETAGGEQAIQAR